MYSTTLLNELQIYRHNSYKCVSFNGMKYDMHTYILFSTVTDQYLLLLHVFLGSKLNNKFRILFLEAVVMNRQIGILNLHKINHKPSQLNHPYQPKKWLDCT